MESLVLSLRRQESQGKIQDTTQHDVKSDSSEAPMSEAITSDASAASMDVQLL